MPSRLVAAALAVAFSASAACSSGTDDVAIAIPEPAPPPIAIDPPAPAPDGGAQEGDGEAVRVEPHGEPLSSTSEVNWDRVNYSPGSGTIDVYWWSGVEPCTVLEGVLLEFTDTELLVTVIEGAPQEAAAISCVAMAVYKMTTVSLDGDLGERRIVDGSKA